MTVKLSFVQLPGDPSESVTSIVDDALFMAVIDNEVETVKKMLEKGANVNSRDHFGRTPLHLFFEVDEDGEFDELDEDGESMPIARLLLSVRADVNAEEYEGKKPIDVAVEEGHSAGVTLLKAIVGYSEPIVDDSDAIVADSEAIVDDSEAICDDSEAIVDDSEAIVICAVTPR